MFCSNCGNQVDDKAVICVKCGAPIHKKPQNDSYSFGWWWLGFFIPLAGFIIWATCTDTAPTKSKRCLFGAIFGVIVPIVLFVLFYLVLFLIGISSMSSGIYY